MNKGKMTRRQFLRTSAGASAAALAASSLPAALAQDATATPLPLPEGQEGTLTVIHRTEYFEEVQNIFRETVVDLPRIRILTWISRLRIQSHLVTSWQRCRPLLPLAIRRIWLTPPISVSLRCTCLICLRMSLMLSKKQ